MAINIQNIIAALEAKVAAATSATETQELIVIIKSIKAAGQQTIVTYANVAALPTASTDNQGNLVFVAGVGKIYYSNGTAWSELGSGSSGGGGGSGGSSYDQSLNTTDNVVFNSSLIGDVSIVGNAIGALDSYGNSDILNVSAPLKVNAEINTLVSKTIPSPGGKILYTIDYGSVGFANTLVFNTWTNDAAEQTFFNSLLNIPTGSEVIVEHLFNSSNYENTAFKFTLNTVNYTLDAYGSGNIAQVFLTSLTPVKTATYDSNNALGAWGDISVLGNYYTNQPSYDAPVAYTSGGIATVTQLSVDSSGVHVNTLNSNTDIVVNADNRSTSLTSYTRQQLGDSNWVHVGTMSGNMTGKQLKAYNWMAEPGPVLATFAAGDKLTFKVQDTLTMTLVDVTFTLTSPFVYSMMENAYIASVLEQSTQPMNTQLSNNIDPVIRKTTSSGSVNTYTFGIDGTLIAPSLVADSALIGDVSIIGNTIGAVDSYGNTEALNINASDVVFDSSVNFKINSLTSTTTTVSAGGASQFGFSSNPSSGQVFRNSSAPNSWADASYFKTGSIVTLPNSMYGNAVIKLTTDLTYTMMDGWIASYTTISGSPSPSYNSSSVTVENTTGSLAEYGLGGDGIFTAPTISTNSLLINGAAPGLLTTNLNGSKSIVVPKTVTTNYSGLYWMQARLTDAMGSSQYQGKLRFENPNQSVIDLFSSLVPGDKVTITRDLQPGTQEYTFTVQTAGFNYDMMANGYILDIVETNTEMSEYYFAYSYGVSVQTIESQEYNFAGDGLVAPSALIGDVSIIGDTIGAVDSYGLPGTLTIDGNLKVAGNTVTSPSDLTVSVGGGTTTHQFTYDMMIGQQFVWSGNTIIAANVSQNAQDLAFLLSMNPGDTLAINNSMYGNQTVHLTTKFVLNGTDYEAIVAEANIYGQYQTSASFVTGTSTIPGANYKFTTDGSLTVNNSPIIDIGYGDVSSSISWPSIDMSSTYQTPITKATYIKTGKIVKLTVDIWYDNSTVINTGYPAPLFTLPSSLPLDTSSTMTPLITTINNPIDGAQGVKYGYYGSTNSIGIESYWGSDAMSPSNGYTWIMISPMNSGMWTGKRHTIEIVYQTTA